MKNNLHAYFLFNSFPSYMEVSLLSSYSIYFQVSYYNSHFLFLLIYSGLPIYLNNVELYIKLYIAQYKIGSPASL